VARIADRLFEWSVTAQVESARIDAVSGGYDKAVAAFDRVYRARHQRQGPYHRKTLRTANELGAVLAAAGRPVEAVRVLEHVVRGIQSHFSDDDPQLADAAAALRATYPLAGVYTSAVGPLARILDQTRYSPRDDNHGEQRAWIGYHLAAAYRDTSDLMRALTILTDEGVLGAEGHAVAAAAAEIERTALAAYGRMQEYARDGHPPLTAGDAGAVSFLDWCCRRTSGDADALRLRAEILKWYETHVGSDAPPTLEARLSYASALLIQGRRDEALVEKQKVLDRRRATLPEQHPDTLLAASTVATSYFDRGRFADVIALAEPAVNEWRHTLGEDHRETLNLGRLLGLSLRAVDRTDEAEPILNWVRAHGYRVD
jgi:tetratricopeptide (TPR) repeat protein